MFNFGGKGRIWAARRLLGRTAACRDGPEQQPGGVGPANAPKAGEAEEKHGREITPGERRSGNRERMN